MGRKFSGDPARCHSVVRPLSSSGTLAKSTAVCSRLVHRPETPMSCNVRIGSTVEHAELQPGGVLDREPARDLDDPPRRRKNGLS